MRIVRLLTIVFVIAIILFSLEKFLFSFERATLFGWWWMHGDSAQKISPVSERINKADLEKYKSEIVNMLKNAEQNSVTQNVALAFAEEFKTDAAIEEQLIVIAHDHPDQMIRCHWQKKLKTGHNLVIITGENGNRTEAVFPIDKKPCLSKPN